MGTGAGAASKHDGRRPDTLARRLHAALLAGGPAGATALAARLGTTANTVQKTLGHMARRGEARSVGWGAWVAEPVAARWRCPTGGVVTGTPAAVAAARRAYGDRRRDQGVNAFVGLAR